MMPPAAPAVSVREAPLAGARRVVVKLGSALVADAARGAVRTERLDGVASDVAALRTGGTQVVLVSSGAVALGRGRLGYAPSRRLRVEEKQAAAAVGQPALMAGWSRALEAHGLVAAQALLTAADTEARQAFLNARRTLRALLACGAVPVVNENDTVATDEIRVGDNDRLAARVAQMTGADVLVLLSDVDGLYTADPRREPGASHLPEVAALTPDILAMAGAANTEAGVGSGGMATKLEAARIAASAGCATLIARGDAPDALALLASGARHTRIAPAAAPEAAYKAWIAGALQPRGALVVDDGAARAVRAGKSLLAAGVRAVEGGFGAGDLVVLRDAMGTVVGRGLATYAAIDAARIVGLRSDAIEAALGWDGGPVVVHADDLVRA
jgi:glutamate 5-kinase